MKETTINDDQEEPHPMIPVPHALRIVLTETATIRRLQFTSEEEGKKTQEIESSEWMEITMNHHTNTNLYGRISYEKVTAIMDYPPYNASIMDGYAIDIDYVKHTLLGFATQQETVHNSTETNDCETNHNNNNNNNNNKSNGSLAFNVIDKVYAGKAKSIPQEFMGLTAVYVTTGAVVPAAYNAVIPIEQVQQVPKYTQEGLDNIDIVNDSYEKNHEKIHIGLHHLLEIVDKHNHWIRPIGCDVPAGTILLSPGQVIEPVHVGLLIQCGIDKVKVTRLPKVGILSTGNELVQLDHHDGDCSSSLLSSDTCDYDMQGIIPDANGPVMVSLLSSFQNCQPAYLGIVKDDEEEHVLQDTLRNAIHNHDVVITTGGISMGEMDVIEKTLLQIGCTLHFGRLHMKPGKPCTFFTYFSTDGRKKLVFALPGNPVSAMVCSELFLRPCLNMLHQWNASLTTADHCHHILDIVDNASVLHPEVFATLKKTVKLDTSRPEYHRVSLNHSLNDQDGSITFSAISTGNQRSSRLYSMNSCDGLMVLPQGMEDGKLLATAGETYPVLILKMPVNGLFKYIKPKDSVHMKSKPITIGIIEVIDRETKFKYETTSQDVHKHIDHQLDHNLYLLLNKYTIDDLCQLEKYIHRMTTYTDVVIIVMNSSAVTLTQNLELNATVNLMISKPLPHVAQLARKGAYACKPKAALFENVAGMYAVGHNSTMLVTLSNDGLDGSLSSIQPLLFQVVNTI